MRDLTIVGGGAAGVLLLAQLARQRRDVAVVEPGALGAGVAYSTVDPAHRLNVRAAGMTAWPDQPNHFVDWLGDRGDGASFVSRATYGAYLASLVPETVRHLRTRATGLVRRDAHWAVQLADGSTVDSVQVALATGVEAPSDAWASRSVRCSPRFVADPWVPGVLDGIGADEPVLVVGTGLTGVDVILTLARSGRRIRAVSRHGLLPTAHTRIAAPPMPLDAGDLPRTLAGLRALIGRRTLATRRDGDWRPAIDGLRRYTERIWIGLSDADREEFLRDDVRRWDIARHRMAPEVGDALAALLHSGQLTVAAVDGPFDYDGWIVNATGPNSDVRRSVDPLTRQLLADGTIAPGPHRIGIDTTVDGQVRDATGQAVPGLWTLGSSRRGQLWESTAIPEIREQAAALADRIVRTGARQPAPIARAARPAVRRVGRSDVYGLPLATGRAAADHYNEALTKVLRVQDGADTALRAAIAEDPHFELAHAALALLCYEGLADGPWRDALDRAEAGQGDDRTRSFTRAVSDRIRRADSAALLAHLEAFPRDALAVSVCVPTIAFGGATEVPERSWALVEGLAPAYGTDWWYLGMLAFIRQEQHRFDESADLADRSLSAEPASGHAAHARAHVYYETGDHVAGLRWLDGWIARDGRAASRRAHYAWHAALHELSLGRTTDVRQRFRDQLAPPVVTGVRALVDSASLLWRCRLRDAWPDNLPIGDVLASVPRSLLREPPTGFVAMHVAFALATADDVDGLDTLHRAADGSATPVFRDLIAPLTGALRSYVVGDFPAVASTLRPLTGRWRRLGGSDAQREVIDDTLRSALVRSGQHDAG